MRLAMCSATLYLSLAGWMAAAHADATARMPTNIPAQELVSALNAMSVLRDVEVVYRPEVVGKLRTEGAVGDFNESELLHKLLSGTGLSYRYLNERTITIVATETSGLQPLPERGLEPLEEIIIEAKYNTPDASVGVLGRRSLLDTPTSVSVVTRDLLDNLQITSVDQLVRTDGSMTVSFAGVGYYPAMMIRGFDLSNRSNYRFDGLTIANNGATGLESVESIEILKGLSGFQAGFAAPGGIVNYVTKRPTRALMSSVELNVDDQADTRAHLDVGGPITDRFAARVNVAGERLRSYVEDADGQRSFFSAAFDWRLSDRTMAHLDVDHHRRAQSQQPMMTLTTLGALPREVDPRRNIGQRWDQYKFNYTLVRADVEHEFSSSWSAALKLNWMDFSRDQRNAFSYEPIEPDGSFNVYEYQSLDESFRPFNALLRTQGRFDTGLLSHDLTVGVSYSQIKDWLPDSVFEFVGINNIYTPRQLPASGLRSSGSKLYDQQREAGAFIHDAIGIGERWQLHLGGRYAQVMYDSYDADGRASRYYDKSVFTPTAALVYRPGRSTSVYASYSEGLEEGGRAPLNAVNSLQTLDPLTSEQYELGIKYATERVDFSTALFEIRKGSEYLRDDGYYVQDGLQTHRGIEVSSAGRLTRRLNVFMSAMWLHAQLDETGTPALDGVRAAGVPRFNASAFLDYELEQVAGLALTFGAYHTSARILIAGERLPVPAFTHLNAGLRYKVRWFDRPTELRLSVDNLMDEFYYSSVAACCAQFDVGPARTVRASIKTYFNEGR